MTIRPRQLSALAAPLMAIFALTACDSGTPEEAAPDGPSATAPADSVLPDSSPAPQPEPVATEIPSSMQGRWGLVAADCEPGRDDAKGLMIVRSGQLEFYESVGDLDEITEATATTIRAAFDFTGEGMTWQRDLSLDLREDGNVLVRQEFGEDAAPQPLRYTKCG